jgi:hypothetical protein
MRVLPHLKHTTRRQLSGAVFWLSEASILTSTDLLRLKDSRLSLTRGKQDGYHIEDIGYDK